MYYLIYKTTNTIDGKVYYGQHKTKDLNDGYLGSGKLLQRAIKKHGKEHFKKEILYYCSSEREMNQFEKNLITEDVVNNPNTYNLMTGGCGGDTFSGKNHSVETRKKMSVSQRNKKPDTDTVRKNKAKGQTGRTHSIESRRKRAKSFNTYLKSEKGQEDIKQNKIKHSRGEYHTPNGIFISLNDAAKGN